MMDAFYLGSAEVLYRVMTGQVAVALIPGKVSQLACSAADVFTS